MNRDNMDYIFQVLKENDKATFYLINGFTLEGVVKHIGEDYFRIEQGINKNKMILLKDKITHILLEK